VSAKCWWVAGHLYSFLALGLGCMWSWTDHAWTEMDWWIHPPSANKNKIRQSILSTDGFIIGKKI
jgi:hypothetical protein